MRGGYRVKIDGKEVFSGNVTLERGRGYEHAARDSGARAGAGIRQSSSLESKRFIEGGRYGVCDDFCATTGPRAGSGTANPSQEIFPEETLFVATALNPVREANRLSASRFSYEKTSVDALKAKLKPEPGQPRVEYVVLPGLKSLPADLRSALQNLCAKAAG